MRVNSYYFLSFFLASCIMSALIPILNELGYSLLQRGWYFTIAALVFIIISYIYVKLGNFYKYRSRSAIIGFYVSSMFLFMVKDPLLVLIALSVGFAFLKLIMSLGETQMMTNKENYGIKRMIAALGLSLGALLSFTMFNQRIIFIIIFTILTIILLLISNKDQIHKFKKGKGSLSGQYYFVVLLFFLIYTITSMDQYIVIEKLIKLDASRFSISLKWAVQSFGDIPALYVLGKYSKKISNKHLLYFSLFIYVIKFALYGYLNNVNWIIMVAGLQVVTLPLINYVSKMMIARLVDDDMMYQSQMISLIFIIGLSSMIAPLLSYYLLNYLGYDISLYGASISLLLVLILCIYYYHKYQRNSNLN